MITGLTTTAKSASARMPLALLGVLAPLLGIHAATSEGAPIVATPTITSKPAKATTATAAALDFSSGSGVTYECSLDGPIFGACSSPRSYAALVFDKHTFQVRAKRPSGQLSPAASSTWIIECTPRPATVITSKPAALSNDTNPSFWFTDAETDAFVCKLDEAALLACSSPHSYSKLADGAHVFHVQARDPAGNTSSPTFYRWTIGAESPPTPTISGHPDQPSTSSTTATFTLTGIEADVGYQCQLDRAAWSACASPRTYTGLDFGRHMFSVRAVDAAVNSSSAASFSWTITHAMNRDFSISGSATGLLYPGAPLQPIALTPSNPNAVAISVTDARVTLASSSSAGCSPAANVAVTQSDVSATNPVRIPPRASVTLPAQGVSAPKLRMLNLTTNQDACKNATFSLSYTGSAHS